VGQGAASELRYHLGYAWGKPSAGQSSFYTDDVKEILVNPEPKGGK